VKYVEAVYIFTVCAPDGLALIEDVKFSNFRTVNGGIYF
jgi:hypothetical protein